MVWIHSRTLQRWQRRCRWDLHWRGCRPKTMYSWNINSGCNQAAAGREGSRRRQCSSWVFTNVEEKGKRMIVKLINKIYQTGELPADFLANIFIPIPKTSNTTKCEEHRTISLISHACKILLYIIKNRITKIINEHLEESQFGFREGSGTRNAIYVLRTICERMMQKKKKMYICFIDYAKAFDNVKHGKLIQIMKQVGPL